MKETLRSVCVHDLLVLRNEQHGEHEQHDDRDDEEMLSVVSDSTIDSEDQLVIEDCDRERLSLRVGVDGIHSDVSVAGVADGLTTVRGAREGVIDGLGDGQRESREGMKSRRDKDRVKVKSIGEQICLKIVGERALDSAAHSIPEVAVTVTTEGQLKGLNVLINPVVSATTTSSPSSSSPSSSSSSSQSGVVRNIETSSDDRK